jgi:hypothetical protein
VLGLATLLGLGFLGVRAPARARGGGLARHRGRCVPAVAQLAFRYPMADRYLYFLLPGLLGAALVTLAPWLRARSRRGGRGPRARRALLAIGLAASVLRRCGAWSSSSAPVCGRPGAGRGGRSPELPRRHPGQITLARRLIAQGDLEGAVAAVERARARGQTNPAAFIQDPSLQPLFQDPRYVAMMQDMTERWIERARQIPEPTISGLMGIAQAELFLGRVDAAFEAMDRAAALASPEQRTAIQQMRSEIEQAVQRSGQETP